MTSSRIPSVAEGETAANSPGEQARIRCFLYKQHGPAPAFRNVGPQGMDLMRFPDSAGILHPSHYWGLYGPEIIICCNRWVVIWQA